MENYTERFRFFTWLHHHLLLVILACYAIAGLLPAPGLAVSHLHFGIIGKGQDALQLSVPFILLSLLLFNSGLSVKRSELVNLRQHPQVLFWGLLINFFLPLAIIFIMAIVLQSWHNPDELQNILVGLALVGAMPIAASSTAWTQKANGNLALSAGLIVFSTLLSPVTTPLALHFSGMLTTGDYSEDLHMLAEGSSKLFLILSVVIPSLTGLLLRSLLTEDWASRLRDQLKELNLLILLILNYLNACLVLPNVIRHPDWDYLLLIGIITTMLCCAAFGAGALIGKLLKTDDANRSALIYGMGMNNNGTGLVLAGMVLADHPLVMLPIIIYNLLQHTAAGIIDEFVLGNR